MGRFIPATETLDQQPPSKPLRRRLIIVVIVVVCIIAIALVVISVAFQPADISDQPAETDTVDLSEETVLTSLNNTDIPAPDLSSYAYVDTEDLTGPRFENISIGEPFIDGATQQTYRVATVTATYQNNSITASTTLLQRFIYDENTASWTGGDISQGALTVEPTAPLSTSIIEENLPTLLENYDASLAKQFEDCSVILWPSLSTEGGTVRAMLSKTEENETLTCTASINVSWINGKGWDINIDSVTDVETSTINENATDTDFEEDSTVELTGTIEMRDEIVLLRTFEDVQINIDDENEPLSTDLFELILNDASLSVTPDEIVTIQGTMTESDALEDVAVAINVTQVQQD